jgi:hypothetical protein
VGLGTLGLGASSRAEDHLRMNHTIKASNIEPGARYGPFFSAWLAIIKTRPTKT